MKFITSILLACFVTMNVKTQTNKNVIKQVQSLCKDYEWDCDNGQCIPEDNHCDGRIDCSDGSDETSSNCIQSYRNCHSYAFRCSYGACITGSFKCNGRSDCADNSDEMVCSDNNLDKFRGKCQMDEIQCLRSGECINYYNVCDGHADCSDGSDETLEVCADVQCPDLAFHCGYGGCINGNAQCNGTKECIDGSDEAWQLCGYPRANRFPVATNSPIHNNNLKDMMYNMKCRLPGNSKNFIIKLHPHNRTIGSNDWVDNYNTIHLECMPDLLLIGNKDYYCDNGKWNAPLPSCFRACKIPNGLSTRYYCFDNNFSRKSCPPILHKMNIFVSCAPGYAGPYQVLQCGNDGKYNGTLPNCVINCGNVLSSITPLAKDGFLTKINEVPWQVAIYNKPDQIRYKYLCAGSIISPSIIISAAHCFWDKANLLVNNVDQYQIAAGKYYRDYDIHFGERPQLSDIAEIIIHSGYNYTNLQWDIAILKLKTPFKFNDNISAVCMTILPAESALRYVPDGWKGLVVGWGTDVGNEVLQRVPMKTRSYHQCYNHLREHGALVSDKFCLENEHQSTLCRGDSGGGFIMFNEITQRYQLWGIISYAPFHINDCARDGFVAVTNINYMSIELQRKLQEFKKQDQNLF